jgi:hypothetical protein
MTRDEFEKLAAAKVPPDYRDHAKRAAKIRVNWPDRPRSGFDANDLFWVSALSAGLAATEGEGSVAPTWSGLPVIPQEIAASIETAEWVRPWAEQVRRDLFGQPEAPFGSTADALAWARTLAEAAVPDTALSDELREALEDFGERVSALKSKGLPFDPVVSTGDHPLLAFPEDRWLVSVSAAWDPTLHTLWRECERITKATGWQPWQSVAFVLTGSDPLIARIRVGVTYPLAPIPPEHGQPGPLSYYRTNIQIRGADVSKDDLAQVFRYIRGMGVAVKKPLKRHEVDAFLIRRGHPGESWQDCLDRYHVQYPPKPGKHEGKITTIRGLQAAVEKVRKRLDASGALPRMGEALAGGSAGKSQGQVEPHGTSEDGSDSDG